MTLTSLLFVIFGRKKRLRESSARKNTRTTASKHRLQWNLQRHHNHFHRHHHFFLDCTLHNSIRFFSSWTIMATKTTSSLSSRHQSSLCIVPPSSLKQFYFCTFLLAEEDRFMPLQDIWNHFLFSNLALLAVNSLKNSTNWSNIYSCGLNWLTYPYKQYTCFICEFCGYSTPSCATKPYSVVLHHCQSERSKISCVCVVLSSSDICVFSRLNTFSVLSVFVVCCGCQISPTLLFATSLMHILFTPLIKQG